MTLGSIFTSDIEICTIHSIFRHNVFLVVRCQRNIFLPEHFVRRTAKRISCDGVSMHHSAETYNIWKQGLNSRAQI